MKIRRLEIQGFKSFADRTVLRFGEGITGVVGPNGCGKSNIVDAIRWVMGEQSAKHLRGSGMQDVIFAGCEARGPMGLCDVTITFHNDGHLVPPEYQGCEEISVTRRLFRDGTSEYAINKVGCRLRDILDLFMGTGIGKNAYSIIEQGRIGLIVTAKPEDRRAFIEDAAGVSRYKARRKMAERRIAATEQNLLRINDLTEELGQRLTSLKKQAEKAEKYKHLKEELRALDLSGAVHRFLEFQALMGFEERAAEILEQEIITGESSFAEEERSLAERDEALARRHEALRDHENALHELRQARALSEKDAAYLARQQQSLADREAEAAAERATLEQEKVALSQERAQADTEGQALDQADGELLLLDERSEALDQARTALQETQESLEVGKQAVVDTLSAIAQQRHALTSIERTDGEIDQQIAKATEARKGASQRARAADAKASEVAKELERNRQLKLKLDDRRDEQGGLLAQMREELELIEGSLRENQQALMDRRSRLKSLQAIHRNYEGCTEAVRLLMHRKSQGADLDPSTTASAPENAALGIHGLVADVLTPEPALEAAVEGLLGERLQHVIVNSQSDAVAAVDLLQVRDAGRSSFVPLDIREPVTSELRLSSEPPGSEPPLAEAAREVAPPAPPSAFPEPGGAVEPPRLSVLPISEGPHQGSVLTELPVPAAVVGDALPASEVPSNAPSDVPWHEAATPWPPADTPEVVGRLTELVSAQPGYEAIARALLGDAVVVEDLGAARRLWAEQPLGAPPVTLVTRQGEVLDGLGVLTGGSHAGVSAGLLKQKREIAELEDAVRRLEAKVTVESERQNTLKHRVVDVEGQLTTLSHERHQEELSIVNLERDLKKLEEEAAREGAERDAKAEEIAFLRSKKSDLVEKRDTAAAAIAAHEAEKERLEETVVHLRTLSTEQQGKVQALQESVTEIRVQVAANREKRDHSRRNLVRLEQRLKDVEARLGKLAESIAQCSRERLEVAEKLEACTTKSTELEAKLAADEEAVTAERGQYEADLEALKADQNAAKAKRGDLDAVKTRLGESKMKVREYELGQNNLIEQVDERYRLSLTDLLVDFHLLAPMRPEDHKKATKLRKQIDNIGPINLTAIDEHAEVATRHEFLAGQKRDLEEAINALRSAIRRINRTSKDRYVEAFRLVNEKFQQVFPKLFNGGRCALVMVDESDPLESGIEMLAQPPGKKLQSVNLLSGGEKALTAVALIFGIFLIKPTPFCLLDEVDAPLDEANVGRYNELLREMSSISQFILITHNKRTMELPDRLYGVTMETPGISKIVPVDVVENKRRLRAV